MWLGNAGAALLGLWAYHSNRWAWRGGKRLVVIAVEALRGVRLSEHRVQCRLGRWQRVEIFSDELRADEYARVRRELKRAAAGSSGRSIS